MQRKTWALVPLIMTSVMVMADGGDKTRGIGKYPGRKTEACIPGRAASNAYGNQAWMRAAWASSSIDYNLTAQLVTDGITTVREPARVRVLTSDGDQDLRDKEKTFDGNKVTSIYVKGEDAFIEYEWSGMAVATHELRLNAWVAYHPQLANEGYDIAVETSDNGVAWHEIGWLRGKELPGTATRQTASSDPNKQESAERLPLRLIDTAIPLVAGKYDRLRLRMRMKGCAYWRLYECMFTDDERGMLPSRQFSSVWMADGVARPSSAAAQDKEPKGELANRLLTMSPIKTASFEASGQTESAASEADGALEYLPQWVYVDLGRPVSFNKVRLLWLHPALEGSLQVSDDAQTWRDVASLKAVETTREEEIQVTDCARYVRVLMTRPGATGFYALSELEVMGKPATAVAESKATAAPLLQLRAGKSYPLSSGWELRREGYDKWVPATVPGTVLASYMNNGAVPDNTVGNAMRQISESYFNSDFWYRTSFRLSGKPQQRVFINLDGINWKADLYVNGHIQGDIQGAFVRGRFDITRYLTAGENVVELRVYRNQHMGAVKVKNGASTDINGGVLGLDNPTFHASIGWDWITSTPGRQVGIWNDVWLSVEKGVHVSDPYVTTVLAKGDTLATMTPVVRVENNLKQAVTATVRGWVGDIKFEKQVALKPLEVRDVAFSPSQYPQLRDRKMRLWWPNGYGEPFLYDAGFAVDGDEVRYKAGIREVRYEDMDTSLKLFVNHKRVVPLGGNWGFSETNLNYRKREYDAAVRYHRDMNFTMIRDWVGQIGDKELYEACDRYGLLLWQDFWLANPWDGPDPQDEKMFMDNARDYIRRIRRHPSVAIYVGRNEGYPPKTIDQSLRQSIAELHPQLGYISSSADDGVSGHGPYRLMPVSYYFGHVSGKLHSEQGIPNVPSLESLRRMLPSDSLWPQNDAWGQHDFTQQGAQRGQSFNEMMERAFGKPASVEQFAAWAQWLNYDGHRAMFEAAGQKRMGLLMWMSHPAWPSMVWQTYDYYLDPTAGYFGVKKACEPLHVQYNSASGKVQVVNRSGVARKQIRVEYDLYNKEGQRLQHEETMLNLSADATFDAFAVALPQRVDTLARPEAFFLRLALSENGVPVSQNTYVLSQEEGNFQSLMSLPDARVSVSQDLRRNGDTWTGAVTLTNETNTPALMLRLNLKDADGEQILPVVYGDNYFHLLPGERRVVPVSFADEDVRVGKPQVEVSSLR